MISTWVAALLIVFAGAYSVGSVGVTGGPNHGEHPFTVTIIHGIVFLLLGKHWPRISQELYCGGLFAAFVLSCSALNLTHSGKTGWRLPVRVLLGLSYALFLVVLFKRP